MPTSVRANYFYFVPNESSADDIVRKIVQFVRNHEDGFVEQHFGGNQFRLSRVSWTPQLGRFSGVMYKKRPTNLPDELTDDGEHTVEIEENAALGDPVCFCYYPGDEMALIQFNAVGARHSTLRSFLQSSIGIEDGIQTSPVLSDEARTRLADVDITRELDFTLRNPKGNLDGSLTEEFGQSLGGDLDRIMEDSGAVNISVRLSMGSDRNGSLGENVLDWADRLLRREEVCSTLKVKGKEGVGDHLHVYDLLNDRMVENDIEVPDADNGRSIDTTRCIQLMHTRYRNTMRPE